MLTPKAVPVAMMTAALLAVMGCDLSRTVTGDDATPGIVVKDLGLADNLTVDAAAPADMSTTFPAALEGVWLIGWSGGMNHFSWVRFSRMATRTMTKKDAWILEGKAITSNLPLLNCKGKATYWMGAAKNTIYLDLPSSGCFPGGAKSPGFIFSNFDTSGAGAPKDAIMSARVQVQSTLQMLEGYKFPNTWCNKAMTSCKAPF